MWYSIFISTFAKNMKFYKIIIQGYDDTCGVMYAPSDWPYPIALDGEEVKNWKSLRLGIISINYRDSNKK